jgi:thioredoxin 1
MGDVRHLDDSNFDSATAKGVALIDFWAEWCGPCRMLGPVVEEIAKEIGNKAVIAKVDVDKAQGLAQKFSVRSIPSIFILKDGQVVQHFIGVKDKKTLLDAITSALG